MKTGRYNLKELLTHNEIEQIIIPEIQRDYVWQEINVNKLLKSIYEAYKSKTESSITINNNNNEPISSNISEYLQMEYKRLCSNHKIGFIYAYHDHEYAGRFFLIDGQQRITTLYLLLLNLYKKADLTKDFKELYFQDEKLKVDYRVRESSHDFLTDFVKHMLSDSLIDFTETNKYYKNEYQHDETIKNLITNYKRIDEFIDNEINNSDNSEDNKGVLEQFLKYVEYFIELNYFDTHLSEQGEQLYIYMNSRGENLSYHEIIKSAIIEKIIETEAITKKTAGKEWEDWQNFFWQNKDKNENADIGFQEFLKWATIIEICTNDEPDVHKLKIIDKRKERYQTLSEAKENYIHRKTDTLSQQIIFLEDYQRNSELFTLDFIKSIFEALKFVVKQNDKYIPFNKKWLTNDLNTIDYVVICPLLYFIANNQWQDDIQKMTDIKRLAMFLKNLTYFESTLGKTPDRATIQVMELVKQLVKNNETDITYFLDQSLDGKYKQILTEFERLKLKIYCANSSPRNEMEKFVWDITLGEELSKFTEGNIQILFSCQENEINTPLINGYDNNIILNLISILNIFEQSIKLFKDDDLLRRTLLTYGIDDNYLFWDNQGYGKAYTDEIIQRYSFISSDDEWRSLFNDHQSKRKIVIDMLIEFKNSQYNEFRQFADFKITSYNSTDWKEPFIKTPEVLNYCGDKMILQQNFNRIILLKRIMTSAAHGEIQTFLLKTKDPNLRLNDEKKAFVCVYDFKLENNQIIENIDIRDAFALEIWWEKSCEWKFKLSLRDNPIVSLSKFENETNWKKNEDSYTKIDEKFSSDDPNKSIMENVNDAKEAFAFLLNEIEQILNK